MLLQLLAVLLASGLAAASPFNDCGTRCDVQWVDITGCDQMPCSFHKGANVTLVANIFSASFAGELTSEFYSVINGVPEILFRDDKACDLLTSGHCPLDVADYSNITISGTVPASLPGGALVLEWKLLDGTGTLLACVQLPALIQ